MKKIKEMDKNRRRRRAKIALEGLIALPLCGILGYILHHILEHFYLAWTDKSTLKKRKIFPEPVSEGLSYEP